MHGGSALRRSWKAGIVVACATLVALLLPTSAMSLNQAAYPQRDSTDQWTLAQVVPSWSESKVVQYQPVTFFATLVYDAGDLDPALPTIEVSYSNAATLTSEDPDAFDISPAEPVTKTLDTGRPRPQGGYELTWAWDVTALKDGPQKLFVHFVPEIFEDGKRLPVPDRNETIPIDVEVHPEQVEFDKAVDSVGEGMTTDVPDDMTVGQEYPVSASIPLTDSEVTAEIELREEEGSVKVSILEVEAPAALASFDSSGDAVITRHWVVTPEEPGEVALVFTARLNGEAGEETLEQSVERTDSARAAAPPPSFWDSLGTPVIVIGGILTALAAGVGIWATIYNIRKGKPKAEAPAGGGEDAAR